MRPCALRVPSQFPSLSSTRSKTDRSIRNVRMELSARSIVEFANTSYPAAWRPNVVPVTGGRNGSELGANRRGRLRQRVDLPLDERAQLGVALGHADSHFVAKASCGLGEKHR